MPNSYLDKTGLTRLWEKIKDIIPTKTSDLTNDSDYLTSSDVFHGCGTRLRSVYTTNYTSATNFIAPVTGWMIARVSGTGENNMNAYIEIRNGNNNPIASSWAGDVNGSATATCPVVAGQTYNVYYLRGNIRFVTIFY